MTTTDTVPPLSGLRAVELAHGSAGEGAGLYLADFGVDVVKVELPEGDPERYAPPLVHGLGRSFLVLNRGKRSAVIDWRIPAGRRCVERLLSAADVLIIDESVPLFPYEDVSTLNPRLIYAAVTAFGPNDRYAGMPGYDPLVQAATGIMATSRDPEGAPISIGYRISEGTTAMLLAYGTMMALLARRRSGRGQRVDVSKAQTAVVMQTTQLIWVAEDPEPARDSYLAGAGCYLCADGRYINVNAMQVRQQEAMYRALGLENILAETAALSQVERQQTLHSLLAGIFETAPSTAWLRLFEEADVPSGPLLSRSDLFVEPQVLENGLRATVVHPAGVDVLALGRPIQLSETPPRPGKRVPALGEHTDAVLAEAGCSEQDIDELQRARVVTPAGSAESATTAIHRTQQRRAAPNHEAPARSDSAEAPLHGVRVLDLATMYAGPGVANFLGDMGAEVIKVEPPNLDDSRRLQATAFVGSNSRAFMSLNRNKRGIIVDLRQPSGREVVHRLVQSADVLINNLRPGVAERLGVDFPTLSILNPRLIYAWVTGFGSRGRYRHRPAYDNLIQVFSGVYDVRRRRSGAPSGTGTFIADCSGPMLYGFAIGTALWARERTGRGQLVEGSLFGLALAVQASEWVTLADAVTAEPALDPVDQACPVLTCADNQSLCIGLVQDEEWQALCELLGQANWLEDARFSHLEDRAAHRPELITLLGPVFRRQPRGRWIDLLRQAGVPAMAVLARNELPHDPFMVESGMFTEVMHPVLGRTTMFSVPVHLSETPGSIRSAAPLPGQHTDAILTEAGYSNDEIARLRREASVV